MKAIKRFFRWYHRIQNRSTQQAVFVVTCFGPILLFLYLAFRLTTLFLFVAVLYFFAYLVLRMFYMIVPLEQ